MAATKSHFALMIVAGTAFVAGCAPTPVTRTVTSEVTTTTTPPPPPPVTTTTITTEEAPPAEDRFVRHRVASARHQPTQWDDVVTEETTQTVPAPVPTTVQTTRRSTTETTADH